MTLRDEAHMMDLYAEIERLHKLIGIIRARDRALNLFNCVSGGWIRQQIEQTFNDEQEVK